MIGYTTFKTKEDFCSWAKNIRASDIVSVEVISTGYRVGYII